MRELAGQVDDWDSLLVRAGGHLAIPFLHARRGELADLAPEGWSERLERAFRVGAAQNLRIAALLVRLHRTLFVPQGIAYAAVKGVTLAQRYYGGLPARACRDLDLLVDPPACPATIGWMLDNGFRLVGSLEVTGEGAERERQIVAMCDLNREISLRSPDGDLVDVHSTLDLTGADFPTARLLAGAEQMTLLGTPVFTLSGPDLLVYLCYHHSRHNWTRLHWVSDMGQVARSPDIAPEALRASAARSGMEELVEACRAMIPLLAAVVNGQQPQLAGLAGTMVQECLTFLAPDAVAPLLEYNLRLQDKGFRWRYWFAQTATEWRQRKGLVRKGRALVRSATPSWDMYQAMPLPRGLRWLYLPLRAGAQLVRHTPLGALFGRKN
nr:nucleotidyltransferase family protein [Alteraurantiacibacter buctensis]